MLKKLDIIVDEWLNDCDINKVIESSDMLIDINYHDSR